MNHILKNAFQKLSKVLRNGNFNRNKEKSTKLLCNIGC